MNRFTSKFFALALALLVAVALIPAGAFGQAISGDLVGTVSDKSGALIPNATVTATNEGTNAKATTTTNASGEYRLGNLPVGTYDIAATATGFSSTTLKGFLVELNKTATARIVMEVGQVATTVEVTAGTPPINTTTAQIETTYQTKEAQDLPTANVGLGVLNLSLLQPGVGSTGGLGAGSGPSIGGQRARNNNFMVEGVDNNDKGVTGPLIYIPNDAVANFSILQNQFSPEFGHSTGGQFNTLMLGGTNTFHGRAYEYFQNRNLNAVDQSLVNQGTFSNPRYDNNRFGGQLGGPIFKDKLFFFANYEYQPIGLATTPGSPVLAPTSAGYSTMLALPGVSTNNVQTLQQYAVAPSACPTDGSSSACPASGFLTVGGTPVEVGILPIVAPNYSNFKALSTSMDYNISDSDQLRGRYIYNKFAFIDNASTLPVFYTSVSQPYHLVALSEYHAFSPTINNELRLGYNRSGYNYGVPALTVPGLDAFPNITVDDLGSLNVGPDPNAPQYSTQNLYQLVDNLTWVKANHTLKFGFEGHKYISPQLFIQRSRGDYDWATLDSFAFDNVPDFGQRSFGSVGYSGDQYALYGFVNDTWKVRPNFSLNLGLRYEFTSVPFGWTQQSLNSVADAPGLIEFKTPVAPKKDFMPRVGFAWSPGDSGNMSIRGGFGMGYDILFDNIGVLSRPPQIGSTTNCPSAACQTPFLANGGIAPQASSGITVLDQADARANTSSYLPNQVQYPYSMQWNLGVQRVFASNYTAEVRYVGTRGVHLDTQNILNFVNIVTPTHSVPTYLQAPDQATLDALPLAWAGPDGTGINGIGDSPGTLSYEYNDLGNFFDPSFLNAGFFSPITAFMPWGSSTYHGLQTDLTRRFSNGLQFNVAYTWSHAIDNSTADFFSTVIAPRRPQNFRDLPAERSNSALDHRHRLTITTIYETPWYSKSSNWFLRNVLSNYEVAPVYTWETGQWGTVQSGVDSNLNADSAPDRAVFNPNGVPGTGSDVSPLFNSSGFTVAYLADNPNAQYIVAGNGAYANGSRNTLLTKPINNWDVSLVKHINITERVRFDIAASLLNAFNHPQYTTGSINQINSISRTTAYRNYFIPSQPTFNDAKASWPSNARTMSLGAKFIF